MGILLVNAYPSFKIPLYLSTTLSNSQLFKHGSQRRVEICRLLFSVTALSVRVLEHTLLAEKLGTETPLFFWFCLCYFLN